MVWLPLVIVIFALAFVTWMFWEMASNPILPPCYIHLTGDVRTDWIFAFVLLNFFTAGYYYLNVYRPGRY